MSDYLHDQNLDPATAEMAADPVLARGEGWSQRSRTRLTALPPALRKELLLARATIERLELAQAWEQTREAAHPTSWLRQLLQRRDWIHWFAGAKQYPFVGSAAAIGLGLLRKIAPKGLFWKLLRLTAGAGIAWWAARAARGDHKQ